MAEYDDIPDCIFKINLVRDFYSKVFNKYPYLFYFLNHLENNDLCAGGCICCFVVKARVEDKENINFKMLIDKEILIKLIIKTITFIVSLNENKADYVPLTHFGRHEELVLY